MSPLVNYQFVDQSYQAMLDKQNLEIQERRAAKRLPPITPIQKTVLFHTSISDGCCRAVEYLFANQGARTDTISAACAIGNVSDCLIGLRKSNTLKLADIGLAVSCERISAMNRFNKKTLIGTWWLEIIDEHKWEQAQLRASAILAECANDASYSLSNEDR